MQGIPTDPLVLCLSRDLDQLHLAFRCRLDPVVQWDCTPCHDLVPTQIQVHRLASNHSASQMHRLEHASVASFRNTACDRLDVMDQDSDGLWA